MSVRFVTVQQPGGFTLNEESNFKERLYFNVVRFKCNMQVEE